MYKIIIILFIFITIINKSYQFVDEKNYLFKNEPLNEDGVLNDNDIGFLSYPILFENETIVTIINITVTNLTYEILKSEMVYCASGWEGKYESQFVCPENNHEEHNCSDIKTDHVEFSDNVLKESLKYPGLTYCDQVIINQTHNCIDSNYGKYGSLYSRAYLKPTNENYPIYQIIDYKWKGNLMVSINSTNLKGFINKSFANDIDDEYFSANLDDGIKDFEKYYLYDYLIYKNKNFYYLGMISDIYLPKANDFGEFQSSTCENFNSTFKKNENIQFAFDLVKSKEIRNNKVDFTFGESYINNKIKDIPLFSHHGRSTLYQDGVWVVKPAEAIVTINFKTKLDFEIYVGIDKD
ncbi:hypothetical protein ACTFIY_009831 [Dictyostelium cf. discoideum]